MKKALRMGINSFFTGEEFEKCISIVKSNIDVIDEITLFASSGGGHHGYTPEAEMLQEAELLKKRIAAYKELGVKKVGINVLCTLGHTEDGGAVNKKAQLQYMVNWDNVESGSCLCPADDRVIEYIKRKYTIYAGVGADHVWSDDDVRIENHGVVRDICFCPCCVEKFNKRFNESYSAEEIRKLWKEDADFRKKWEKSAHITMIELITSIRDAIKAVDGSIDIGFMTSGGNHIYEWLDASGAVKGRPGASFYNERYPMELFEKSFWMQKETMDYPERMKDIQYEYETYNGRTLEKTNHMSEIETTMCAMVGCNGILYNRAHWKRDEAFFEMMRASKKKWDMLTDVNKDCHNMGIYCETAVSGRQLNEISIPVTSRLECAQAAMVLGEEWKSYTMEETRKILEKNVLTDGRGLQILSEYGIEGLCARVKKTYRDGVDEMYAEHQFNGDYKGEKRHVSLDLLYEGDAFLLEPAPDAECLSHLVTRDEVLGCSLCMARLSEDRKFAVDGCMMPNQMQTASKREQLMNVLDWLTDNTLPVIIKKPIKVVPTVCGREGDVASVMLLNASLDATGTFEVEIRSGKEFYMLTESGEVEHVAQKHDGSRTFIQIDNIGAWQYILLITEG